ncbi:OmpA family protein [Marinobacter caseinilyticus]|uniref:OmpA family protein n=1 Tax=Marinobacter caseinilyticus TaxID=2692195 RepID=UPI001F443CCA|nr:OmpA family protein [Marinobacter caseinilyticus]
MPHLIQTRRLPSAQPIWLSLCGGVLVSALAGCAGNPDQSDPSLSATHPVAKAEPVTTVVANTPKPTPTATIDQSPIVLETITDNSSDQPSHRPNATKKDTDMTVLVLDDPELITKAAAMEAGSIMPVNSLEDSARRPHRTRFHYGFDKHRLNDEDLQILRAHAAYLVAHPEVTVQIHGHTDNFGAEEYNAFLARLRAGAAAKLLRSEGVRDAQIQVTGWGSTKPLTNPEDHAANRRLELEYHTGQMAKAL